MAFDHRDVFMGWAFDFSIILKYVDIHTNQNGHMRRGPQLVVCAYEILKSGDTTNHVILRIREYAALYTETAR